jgi:hypothetical protein
MFASVRSRLPTLVLLTLGMVLSTVVTINPTHAQRGQTTDNPFVVVITIQGVDNRTGFITNWITANNVTKETFYNASELDLRDTIPNDGFLDVTLVLPNGTMQVGDEFKACTLILKDVYLRCDKGFNAPTNRAEFVDVLTPSLENNNNTKGIKS